MRHGRRNHGWRPVTAIAALGTVLGGCCCGPRYFGDTGNDRYGPRVGPNAPASSWQYDRALGGSSGSRGGNWSQQQLQRHWQEQARQAR